MPPEQRINNGLAPARSPKRGGEVFSSGKAEAERVVKLTGGTDKLLASAQEALAANDNQRACQLADHLLAIEANDKNAKQIKANALTKLARDMVNATARNYVTVHQNRNRRGV